MRKRDIERKKRKEYINSQFSSEKTERHIIKVERKGIQQYSTLEGLQYLNNREKIFFICETCGKKTFKNKELIIKRRLYV